MRHCLAGQSVAYRALLLVPVLLLFNAATGAIDGASFGFDKRAWRIGYEAANKHAAIVEYVLPGETVHDWTELITVQRFRGIPARITPQSFMKRLERMTKQKCATTTWRVIRRTEHSVLYHWRTQGCQHVADQHEIAKLQRTSTGLYRFSYVSKKLPLTKSQFKRWRHLVGNARAR